MTLNLGCILIIMGVYIEKGMGLIVPGFLPDTLGEIYEYSPTRAEILITMGIWACGALLYTLLLKFAVPIYTGRLRFRNKRIKLMKWWSILARQRSTVIRSIAMSPYPVWRFANR